MRTALLRLLVFAALTIAFAACEGRAEDTELGTAPAGATTTPGPFAGPSDPGNLSDVPWSVVSLHIGTFSDENNGWIVADSQTSILLHTSDAGIHWAALYSFPAGVTDIDFLDGKTGWATSYDGIFKTLDGGSTWDQLSGRIVNPEWPIEADGFPLKSAQQIDFVDLDTGWLAGSDLYRTSDGGQTWNKLNVPCAKNAEKNFAYSGRISFIDSRLGWMACPTYASEQGSQMFRTSDGGARWEALPDAEFVPSAISSIDETSGWAGATEKLFVTSDGGESWTLAARGLVNDLPVPMPTTGGRLYVISGSASLQGSVDGGATWEVLYPPPLRAAVSCQESDLLASVEWSRSGDPGPNTTSNQYFYAGTVGAKITLTNASGRSCQVTSAEPSAKIVDAEGQTVAQNQDTAAPSGVSFILTPDGQALSSIQWSNWCGPQAAPLSLVLEVPNVGQFTAQALSANGEPISVPYCHEAIGTGTGLRAAGLWPAEPPSNPP